MQETYKLPAQERKILRADKQNTGRFTMCRLNKIRLLLPLGLLLLLSLSLSGCSVFDFNLKSVTLDNGKTYTYYSTDDAANDSYSAGDIRWSELSRQEIQDILDLHTEDIPDHDFGPITTARQAVKCGAAVLDEVYERWTETDNVGVYHSQKANIWLVHGMYHDRLSDYNGLGYVVLDADTGEILGTAYETAGTFA